MAEQLEIVIGANVDDAKAGVKDLQGVITDFARQGKLSIGVVEQSLKELRGLIKTTSDPTEVGKLKQAYVELQRTLQQLKVSGGLESQLNGISRSTRLAHSDLDQMSRSLASIASGNGNVLEGLSRVAFSFEQLRGQTGSTKSALAELGAVLTSPAGLLVAGAALAPLLIEIGTKFLAMADGSRQAKEDIDNLTASLKASKEILGSFNDEINAAAVTRKLNIDIETPPGLDRTLKELNSDLDTAGQILKNNQPAIDAFTDDIARLEAASKKAAEANKDLLGGSIPFRRNANLIAENDAQVTKLKENIASLKKELDKAGEAVINIPLRIKLAKTDEARADAKKQFELFNRDIISLAQEAEKLFKIPVGLELSKFDSDFEKLRKSLLIIGGIKDFTIPIKVDFKLPDIKELPKEQVEKFFKEVPNALQDAVDKGIIEAQGHDLNIGTGPFAKEIEDIIDKFNKAGLTIPVTFDLKDADLLIKLRDAFPIEQIQKNVDELKKSLGTEDTFQGFIRDLIKLGDEGQKAFDATAKAALDAGDSITTALRKAADAQESVGGISKEAGEAALVLQQTLAPAFENLFSSIIQGQAPLEAFFKSLIQGIDQLIAKLIAAALEALILSSITGGIGGFGGIFKALLGFEKGGDPAPDKPFIAGEKGWELIVPKTSMHVFTHEQSKSILSTSSVKDNQSIKEYLIATRISQEVKEYFNTSFTERIKEGIRLSLVPIETKISDSVRSMTANNEKLTAYTYRLHEQSSQTIEKIALLTDRTTSSNQIVSFEKVSDSIKSLITSSFSDKDHLVKSDSIDTFKTIVSSFKESSTDKRSTETFKHSFDRLHESVSSIIEKIIPYAKPSENITSKETVATIVKGDNESSHYENSLREIVKNLTSTGIISNKFTDHFSTDKSIKELQSTTSRTFSIASEKVASSFKELHSTSAKAIDRLHESVTNNLSSSIDKLHETISERSDKSVTIERIINNNFFSSDSFKETFKSMSLTDLQKTFHIPAFAQGGAVFGPTLAILGEGFGISRGNPEFVGTRSQLSGIQGGQFDVNVNVDGELSFDMGKLAIALNRNQRSSFRTSGKPGF